MLHQWGLLGRLFARLFFSKIAFPAEGVETIRKAAQQGTVVYVMRLRNTLEFLYFSYAFTAHGLPLARFANGVRLSFWQPLRLLLRGLFGRKRRAPMESFRRLLNGRRSTALFLRSLDLLPKPDFEGPYLRTLIEVQRETGQPIVLVPLTMFWGEAVIRPTEGGTAGAVFDRVLGNQDEPRLLRRIWQVIRHARRSVAHVGVPVSLENFIADQPDNAQAATALEAELLERIEAERRVRLGPRRSHFVQLRQQILRLPAMQHAIQQRAEQTGQSRARVERYVFRTLKRMQAQFTSRGLLRVSRLVRWVSGRLFEGFEIDEKGVLASQETGKAGPLLFLPTHRSHIDYLIISDLLHERGVVPPHIAAGINLAFWPMGWLFRKAGAFFLKRRFHGDELYSTLIREYMRALLCEAHTLEIFIEGGRSRTGRILPPKLGLLAVVADLCIKGEVPPVFIIPVSIGYERVPETNSLTRELTGGKKQPESIGALLKAARVLRDRGSFGYVNVQFNKAISIAEFLRQRNYDAGDTRPEVRHHAIRSLGYHALTAAGEITAVTCTALCAAAIAGPGTLGVSRRTVREAIDVLARAALQSGAPFVTGIWTEDQRTILIDEVLDRGMDMLHRERAIRTLGAGEDRIYASEEDARVRLEFNKNHLVQHLLNSALLAGVLRAIAGRKGLGPNSDQQLAITVSRETIHAACAFAASLVRLHFVANAGKEVHALTEQAIDRLTALELIQPGEGTIVLQAGALRKLGYLAGQVESLLESQRAVTDTLLTLRSGPRLRKNLESELLSRLHQLYLIAQLRRYESCQLPLVRAAIDWLCDEGILFQQAVIQGVEVALTRQHETGRALEILVARIDQLLPPSSG
jgi:glycerol-3-phosphate O-acyltransferase